MKEERIEMSNIPSSAPQSETISSIPENGDIKEALRVLDDNLWLNDEQFLRPWGSQKITLVHLAAFRGHIGMLKRAAALDVDLYAPDGFGRSAVYHAADQGCINVIEWLMDQPAAHEGPSETTSPTEDQGSLPASGSNTAPHQAVETEPHETREDDKLRKRSPSSFDTQDKDGRTPLHAAVYGRNPECVRLLIEKGLCLANTTKTGVTVIDAIYKQIPHPTAFLEEILDKQVSAADDSGHKVNLDFTILTALPNAQVPEAESTSMAKLFVVLALFTAVPAYTPSTEDLKILEHPLVATFIYQKFPVTTPFYFFLLFCDVYIAIDLCWCHSHTKAQSVQDLPTSFAFRVFGIIMRVAPILMYILNTVGNCRDKILSNLFSRSKKVFYFYVLLVTTRLAGTVFPSIVINDICGNDRIDGVEKTFHAAMSLLSWFFTLTTLLFLPLVGVYIVAFKVVLFDVLKVLGIFSVLIMGFSLTFRILFFDIDQFSTPWKALGKTLVMMTGEYDYNNLSSSTIKTDDTPNVDVKATFLFIFLIFVSIVLMNLMIGLAVNDTQQLLKKGHNEWLSSHIAIRFHWIGLYYLISRVLTRCKNGEQTEEPTCTVLLDLESTSRIPWRRLPKEVKNGLLELALKNSANRDEKSEADLLRDDIQKSLTASQTMLAEIRSIQSSLQGIVVEQQLQNSADLLRDAASRTMLAEIRSIQSSLQGVVVEQQLQNCQIQQLTQNRMTERHRRSLPTILWHPIIDSRASPTTESI